MSPAVQATVGLRALWDRMEAHGMSQNEAARLAGISSSMLSQIMNGKRIPSGDVLRRLYDALFRPAAAEMVVPAEVKVLAWKKGGRNGVMVRGGGPGGESIRTGGGCPGAPRLSTPIARGMAAGGGFR